MSWINRVNDSSIEGAAGAGNPAKTLADAFGALRSLGVMDRQIFHAIMKETLGRHPEFLGVWTVWEPNALDGRDHEYANAPGHDATGRFVPFWHRVGGRIQVEPNVNYDVPGLGDWYLVPMQRRRETVLDPYEVPADGNPVFITSMVAPIQVGGECVGAAGVDVGMDELIGQRSETIERTLRRGYVFLDKWGRVEYWSARTQELVSHFVGRVVNGELPAALAGHCRRLREHPQVSRTSHTSRTSHASYESHGSRASELPAFRRGTAELRIRYVRHPRRGRIVLIVEENAKGMVAPEEVLTAREREVFEWLGQGKSNGEIAMILGLSVHTVKRHVERILSKLAVENRCAAALLSASGGKPRADTSIGHSTYIGVQPVRV